MKNNTKLRIHVPKHLFESLIQEVLAEGKGVKGDHAMKLTSKMLKMHETRAKKAKEEKLDELSAGLKQRAMNKALQQAADQDQTGDVLKQYRRLDQYRTSRDHVDPSLQPEGDKIASQMYRNGGTCDIHVQRENNAVRLEFKGTGSPSVVILVTPKGYKFLRGSINDVHAVARPLEKFINKVRSTEIAESNELEESETLNEDMPSAQELIGIIAGIGSLGLGGMAVAKIQDYIKKKNPELYKKLEDTHATMDKAYRGGIDE